MPLTHIKIARDLQELTLYGSKEFPVALYETTLRLASMDVLPLHWHKEIQFVYIKSGCVQYRIEADVVVLETGEGLFINTSRLHEAKPYHVEQAVTYCVNIDPLLIGGREDSIIMAKYIQPYITNNRLSYRKLTDELSQKVKHMANLLQEQAPFFELKVWGELLGIWESMLAQSMLTEDIMAPSTIVQHERPKAMLDFLHTHYHQKITLADLAAHVYVSPAECSCFFKKIVGLTPFTYLSPTLSTSHKHGAIEGSRARHYHNCGDDGLGYYIEKFKEYTGYSPHVYRKKFLQ
ncbi:AraC family ligand binding domain-containing protein [Lysinibacillus sp. FSL H8-0500]|uniref:AraC family ligand binding domain-containing protein n=1 Tax=Lysinibacillus sp. FSL H8-0500 TaxID=2921393 RepID=UPI003101AEDE